LIHHYNHDHLRRWNRGEHQVRIEIPGRNLPMGYCDGTDDDEAELRAIAEEEGLDDLPIHKRVLKTGRAIWTVGNPPQLDEAEDDD
jgi:hypothetical protein